jgi:glyoxylase-like metal-dependent hydrolase (beta-lactamase superfamily II)
MKNKTLKVTLLLALAATASAGSLDTWTSGPTGFDTKSHWYDTGAEVVVFDAQFTPALAGELIAAIRAKTASPIRWLVITHPNPDKFNGAPAFRALGAKVVASRATAAAIPGVHAYKKAFFVGAGMFTDATYPAEPQVDVTFDSTLDLGSVRLATLAHAGVSSTQTIAHVPAANALIVGDLVHHRAHAWLEGGIVEGAPRPDLDSWKAALRELLAFPGAIVHGGRGESAPVEEAVAAQIAYLDGARDVVTAYLADLAGAPDYKELARRMSEAFPHHALPYLIEYGAYGLVNRLR